MSVDYVLAVMNKNTHRSSFEWQILCEELLKQAVVVGNHELNEWDGAIAIPKKEVQNKTIDYTPA